MPPFAPMIPTVQPLNLTMPWSASPWANAGVLPSSLPASLPSLQWSPIGVIGLRPTLLTPVAPVGPLSSRTQSASVFIRFPHAVTWQQLLRGHTSARLVSFTPASVQSGRHDKTQFVTTTPHAPTKNRAAFENASPRQEFIGPHTPHHDQDRIDPSHTPELSENFTGHEAKVSDRSPVVLESRTSGAGRPRIATTVDRSHLHSSRPIPRDDSVAPPESGISSLNHEPGLVIQEEKISSNPLTRQEGHLESMLASQRGPDRSRLWDYQVTQALFRFQQQHASLSAAKIPPTQQTSVDSTEMAQTGTDLRPGAIRRASQLPDADDAATPRQVGETRKYELAGLANIQAVLQQRPESRLGLWFRQVLAAPPSQSRTLKQSAQQLLQLQTDLAKTPSVIQTLQNELARLDGELRVVPLPHNLPNMGELSRKILLSAHGSANPYQNQQAPSQQDTAQSPLARQVRQAHQDTGYLDEATRQVRTLANAQEGKDYLHFLAHLARKNGMTLIAMINYVNETIGFGPFRKHKDINGTIRSMDPRRWGKDSEVLLHPLMGRANLVINVLDLIENNRITIEEVRDLLRINSDADILERLEVEIAAAQIYRQDGEWWQQVWSGQDAEALKPWFDDLLAQISTGIVDLKDVLAFVTDLETGSAANDNAARISA